MAPIKIHIKSSSADIAEQSSANTEPSTIETTADTSSTSVKASDSVGFGSANAPTDSEKVITKNDESESTEDKQISCEESSEAEQIKSTDAIESKDTPRAQRTTGPEEGSSELYEYEGDDVFYTNKATKVRYKWNNETGSWVDLTGGEAVAPSSMSDQYEFDGKCYFYLNSEGQKVRWNAEKEEWTQEEVESEESEEDDSTTEEEKKARQYRKRKAAPGWSKDNTQKDPVTGRITYKDEKDGLTYEWDEAKKAWFPALNEDFMAMYQLNYGFTKDGEAKPTVPEPEPEPEPEAAQEAPKKKNKKEVEPPKWFEEDVNKTTKVYVSGLPPTVTEESLLEFMSKCGMVEHDVRTKKARIKIYRDPANNGQPKGDALCSYIKPESVQLALTILDGSEFEGQRVSVQRAKFEMKGEAYDPKLKPKKLRKKELDKLKRQREKLFAWIPDKLKGERYKFEKVIVIKNLFDPEEFDRDPGRILDYTSRIRAQCSKFGTITKLALYDKHEEGVCQVHFKEPEEADMAKELLHGRLFGKRIMNVTTWDGKTKYKKEESKEEEEERLAKWERYLAGEEAAQLHTEADNIDQKKDEEKDKEMYEEKDEEIDEEKDEEIDEENNEEMDEEKDEEIESSDHEKKESNTQSESNGDSSVLADGEK